MRVLKLNVNLKNLWFNSVPRGVSFMYTEVRVSAYKYRIDKDLTRI